MEQEERLIVTLTVAELRQLIEDSIKDEKKESPDKMRYTVKGIKGIEDLLGVSHKTAQHYKNTFLKPAVFQRGRKIVTDAEMALKLFHDHKKKQEDGSED